MKWIVDPHGRHGVVGHPLQGHECRGRQQSECRADIHVALRRGHCIRPGVGLDQAVAGKAVRAHDLSEATGHDARAGGLCQLQLARAEPARPHPPYRRGASIQGNGGRSARKGCNGQPGRPGDGIAGGILSLHRNHAIGALGNVRDSERLRLAAGSDDQRARRRQIGR
ncbi:MAG: hypothetical protein KGR26_00290 [Cyanobacteria bacterium REEB65]|nr:hypothetical protein [Cyanobacteria bacterium REEB65]